MPSPAQWFAQEELIAALSSPNTCSCGKPMRSEDAWVCRQPFIRVMEAPDLGHRHHPTTLPRVERVWLWTIHRQGQMRSPVMVIGKWDRQDAREMPLVEDDHVVQALPSDRAKSILPPSSRGISCTSPMRFLVSQSHSG